LWNLDQSTCEDILTTLVEEQFLIQTPRGTYLRRSGGQYTPIGSAIGPLRDNGEVAS
jgi:hypothetical protein